VPLWVVWVAVVVLALVVLAVLAFGVLGAVRRLARELRAAEDDVRPFVTQAQATAARAAALQAGEQHSHGG
jgi:Na+-transporting methylmalonyl-CoA/oxaloacetate decarboxylase gamma subunit